MRATRRLFIAHAVIASALAVTGRAAWAADELQESDPAAQALGYRIDASRVDSAKYPRFKSNQRCANCQFYQGAPSETSARCALFGAKEVRATGWCNGYQARA